MKSWLLSEQRILTEQIVNDNLPHAIIFSGVNGAGKNQLASWLAQALICQDSVQNQAAMLPEQPAELPCRQCKNCHLFEQQAHPDYLTVEADGNSIGVDQIRQTSGFLEKTAQLGHNQVVVIFDADMMTESAANALLKTLEEPTANSYLLLLVKDSQHLLPTIVSRCRQVQLRPPVGEQLIASLGKHSEDRFVNLSHFAELTDDKLQEDFQQLAEQFICYLYFGQRRMALLKRLDEGADRLRWLEKITVDLLRGHYQWQSLTIPAVIELDKFSHFLHDNRDALYQVYQMITDYNKKVISYSQFNRAFGLEKLLVDIQGVIHG